MATQKQDSLQIVAGAFRASAEVYGQMGTPLYAEFCRRGAEDPEILALADHGMEGAKPSHLFCAVHYLLLGDPSDPLASYFATLAEAPLPPDGAYPELVRFCREHEDELQTLLRTRTVQMTYAERCRVLLPAMCEVAAEAGKPLNIVEVGCSAGVLLVFDKFAYRLNEQGTVGPEGAPFVLEGKLNGGPALFIPEIGMRAGIDLHTIDVSSEEERRWLLSLCFPELRDEQARLAKALDVVAATDIRLMEGDGLKRIKEAMAALPDPLCIFHSACLFYWPKEAKAILEDLLLEESRGRTFWRIAIEPSDTFDEWHKGRQSQSRSNRHTGETVISCYSNGEVTHRVAGGHNPDYGVIDWFD